MLFQPRKEETWLLTQLICLLRKQPHNDFHYRTWNWFCYDNCCICNCCKILFVEIQNWNSKKLILQKRLLSKYIEKLERLCNRVTIINFRLLDPFLVFFLEMGCSFIQFSFESHSIYLHALYRFNVFSNWKISWSHIPKCVIGIYFRPLNRKYRELGKQ